MTEFLKTGIFFAITIFSCIQLQHVAAKGKLNKCTKNCTHTHNNAKLQIGLDSAIGHWADWGKCRPNHFASFMAWDTVFRLPYSKISEIVLGCSEILKSGKLDENVDVITSTRRGVEKIKNYTHYWFGFLCVIVGFNPYIFVFFYFAEIHSKEKEKHFQDCFYGALPIVGVELKIQNIGSNSIAPFPEHDASPEKIVQIFFYCGNGKLKKNFNPVTFKSLRAGTNTTGHVKSVKKFCPLDTAICGFRSRVYFRHESKLPSRYKTMYYYGNFDNFCVLR